MPANRGRAFPTVIEIPRSPWESWEISVFSPLESWEIALVSTFRANPRAYLLCFSHGGSMTMIVTKSYLKYEIWSLS